MPLSAGASGCLPSTILDLPVTVVLGLSLGKVPILVLSVWHGGSDTPSGGDARTPSPDWSGQRGHTGTSPETGHASSCPLPGGSVLAEKMCLITACPEPNHPQVQK